MNAVLVYALKLILKSNHVYKYTW